MYAVVDLMSVFTLFDCMFVVQYYASFSAKRNSHINKKKLLPSKRNGVQVKKKPRKKAVENKLPYPTVSYRFLFLCPRGDRTHAIAFVSFRRRRKTTRLISGYLDDCFTQVFDFSPLPVAVLSQISQDVSCFCD